jgi:xanthine dehydrogenase small subunit
MRNEIIFYVNGKRHEVGNEQAGMMLGDYLRYEKFMTGTKIVCAEGDCGACSVLKFNPHVKGTDAQNYIPVNSCVSLVACLDGMSLITIEGLKNNGELHATQKALVENHGTQCGFCTPGFAVTLAGLTEEKLNKKESTISEVEVKNCLTGNLCRCTGYQSIIDAGTNIDMAKCGSLKSRHFSSEQEVELTKVFSESLFLETTEFTFFAPKTMKEAVEYLNEKPDVRIVAASTDLGVLHNKRKAKLTHVMSLHLMDELYLCEVSETQVKLGARVTLTELRHEVKDKVDELADYLDIFASPQIKNNATIVGNVANASPIGDMPTALLALDATLTLESVDGVREVALSEYNLDYKKTVLKKNEIISFITFNIPKSNSDFRLYKNSARKDLDISVVNYGIRVDWDKDSRISDIRLAVGGVAATTIRLRKTETILKGQKVDSALIEKAIATLHTEFTPFSDVRASSGYRHLLIENYFKRSLEKFASAQGGK